MLVEFMLGLWLDSLFMVEDSYDGLFFIIFHNNLQYVTMSRGNPHHHQVFGMFETTFNGLV